MVDVQTAIVPGIIFLYVPSQWETTLQCNVVSLWLGAFTKWSLGPMHDTLIFWMRHFTLCSHHRDYKTDIYICILSCRYTVWLPHATMKLELEVLASTTIKRKKPWPRLAWAGEVRYHQTSNMKCTLVGNEVVDHSDVVGASPVGAAPTTSSFSI